MKLTPAYLSSNYENITEQKSIDLHNRNISHIEDISFCVNLRKLDLSNNCLRSGESLSGLKYCKSLTWLNLSYNKLESFDFICELENLTGTTQ